MRPIEIVFWDVLYTALYMPMAVVIDIAQGQGHIIGFMLIGLAFTAVLTIYLVFQEGALLDDIDFPVVSISNVGAVTTEIQAPKKKRGRPRKQKEDQIPKQEVEVQPNVEETKERTKDSIAIGTEPEPKMWTDVDLGKLDAANDDLLS